MTEILVRTGFLGSVVALLAASACCVLPMSLMIAGFGGGWMAVFSPVAAVSPYLVGISFLLLVAAWFVALRSGSGRGTIALLALGSAFTATAWLLLINQERLTMLFPAYM